MTIKLSTSACSFAIVALLIPHFGSARIAVPRPGLMPRVESSDVQLVAASNKNCKFQRGFQTRSCQAARLPTGNVLPKNCGRGHKGCDYSRANRGQKAPPVQATSAGKVIFAGWDRSGYGNRVVIDHGGGNFTTYSHSASFHVKKGSQVSRGASLGIMGTTGSSTGVHLHFEVIKNNKFIDPKGTYASFCR